MAGTHTIVSSFSPIQIDEHLSIPEFFTRYNPDDVPHDKIVHTDTIAGKSVTYGGLRTAAASCAWGLQNLGLKEGNVVMAVIPNSTDFVILAHSVWWMGAIFSPVNTSSTTKDLAHCIGLVNPSYIAVSPPYLRAVREAVKNSSLGRRGLEPQIFTVLDRVEGLKKFPEDIAGKNISETLRPFSLGYRSAKKTTAVICFSSGTTGKMKGVQLSHFNLMSNVHQYRTTIPSRINCYQREVFFPPYCHIYGLGTVVLLGMWLGNFTCALPAFDLEIFCQKMAEHRATWAHIVPPVALLLAASDSPIKYDLSTLECLVVAAAPLKKALQSKLKTRFPVAVVCQGYGLSECSPSVTIQLERDEEKLGTCGKLFSGTEARLVDPNTGKDVALGEEGELWVRGPQVMMGYIGDEAATRNSFSGAWLKTGDIMKLDQSGNFYVTDRLKEMIKYKGFQIAPSELEDILLRHPHVTDAAVCAIYDDDQATEVPLAYVSLIQDYASLLPEQIQDVLDDIRSWIDSKVAGYKKLRGGVFHLQDLPKTSSGKISRKDLPAKLKLLRESKM